MKELTLWKDGENAVTGEVDSGDLWIEVSPGDLFGDKMVRDWPDGFHVIKTAGDPLPPHEDEIMYKAATFDQIIAKANPNHDKATGQFAAAHAAAMAATEKVKASPTAFNHTSARDAHMHARRIAQKEGHFADATTHHARASEHDAQAKGARVAGFRSVRREANPVTSPMDTIREAMRRSGGGGMAQSTDAKRRTTKKSATHRDGDWLAERENFGNRDGDIEFEAAFEFKITKLDDAKRMVYGFASVTSVNGAVISDLQNDSVTMEDITTAAHEFMKSHRVGGEMHREGLHGGDVVESLMIDEDTKRVLGITRPEEGWFIGYHVTDDNVWKRVQSGEYAAFSIGGTGRRVPMD